jgi:uncharacterized membrane protein (UPF0127 family)
MRFFAPCLAALALCACGPKPDTLDDLNTIDVTLPGGQVIRAESKATAEEMLQGLMFRDSLAPNRGMLFFHRAPGKYSYWMYQTHIPLDIIWMDATRSIVEIVPNAPPCKTAASQCPHYGGRQIAKYVLELAGGQAQKYNLKEGDTLRF